LLINDHIQRSLKYKKIEKQQENRRRHIFVFINVREYRRGNTGGAIKNGQSRSNW
jgi:hypothetical protein